MKEVIESRGIQSKPLDILFKDLYINNLKDSDKETHLNVGLELLRSNFIEDQYIGIDTLNKISKQLDKNDLEKIKQEFINGNIQNWATCDVICGKVIKIWTLQSEENTRFIAKWSESKDNLWLRRCSCVTFVTRARHSDKSPPNFKGFEQILFEICDNVLPHQERFSQLGVGWLLREMYLANSQKTKQYIATNYDLFTREGLRYAIEKMSFSERSAMLKLKKDSPDQDTLQKRIKQIVEDQNKEQLDDESLSEIDKQDKKNKPPKKQAQKSK